MNVNDDRTAEIVAVAREHGMNVQGKLNEIEINKEEVQEALTDIKSGKAAGLDEYAVEFEEWWSDCGRVVSEVVEYTFPEQHGAN